ncbi:hypothetical protein MTR_4g108810 [Medicago truncatula]|uniref:F-box protein interaction domain protein n=1 Tax=Medicago truncatula TaxID=3880 RepID=A0A072URG9_MEDTR|nr:hypothetical protein MTR_4g108810 [Medicago truncatula]
MGGDDDTIANRTRSKKRLRHHSQGIVYKLLPVLPEEIIVEIILRLPLRSLLQFKCTTIQNFPCEWDEHPDRDTLVWLGKFVSGTLNWIVNTNKNGVGSNSTNQKVIISFNVEKETYGEVLLPQHDGHNVLCVLSNCICVSVDQKTHWVVWMMKEYGVIESWAKLIIIPQDNLISDIFRCLWSDALFISENGVLLLRPKLSKLVVYNLKNNGSLHYRSTNFGKFAFDLHIYHESLVSPQW